MLQTAGVDPQGIEPKTPVAFRVLQGVLAVSLLFLLLCIAIAVVYGQPGRERIQSCPDGQIAIVSRDADGSLVTLCQYRLGG
jgi:hypothetical protein